MLHSATECFLASSQRAHAACQSAGDRLIFPISATRTSPIVISPALPLASTRHFPLGAHAAKYSLTLLQRRSSARRGLTRQPFHPAILCSSSSRLAKIAVRTQTSRNQTKHPPADQHHRSLFAPSPTSRRQYLLQRDRHAHRPTKAIFKIALI